MLEQEQPLQTTLVRPSAYEIPPPPMPADPAGHPGAAAFTAGEVIGKTLKVWWKNLAPFTVLSLVSSAPIVVWILEFQRRMLDVQRDPAAFGRDAFVRAVWTFGVGWLLTAVLMTVSIGAMARAAFGELRGERVSFGAMLQTGLRRGLPVVVATFVVSLAMLLALPFLVFPAVMLGCAWAATVPAAVVERLGPFAALGRSASLTSGYRWKVFGTFAALFGIVWGLSLVVQLGASAVALLALSPDRAPLGTLVVSQLGSALFSCIPSVGCAVVYHDLRAAREGLDGSQLAAVFE